jgi:hypothetical protein
MRVTLHKLLSCTILAAYASVMIIGEGLHSLAPGHDHHHGLNVVTHTSHSHGHAHHDHCCKHHSHGGGCHDHHHGHSHDRDNDQVPTGPVFAATDGESHSHACDICAFLYQAVSQPPQVATTPDLHPRVADLPCVITERYSSAVLGLHAARGPPQHGV